LAEHLGSLRLYLRKKGKSEKEISNFLLSLVRLGVSADRFTGDDEFELYNDIFGSKVSYEDFFALTDGGSDERFVNVLDATIDSLDKDAKNLCLEFVFLFLNSDYHLGSDEAKLFEKLLA